MPKISVILPVYNAEAFLPEAIASILGQSYADFELLIIDDGSTDGSLAAIERFNDARITLFIREHAGITKTLNFGIAQAQGDYIARMDADDIAAPARFEKQAAFLDKNPSVSAVGCWYRLINNKAEIIKKVTPPTEPKLIKKAFFTGAPLVHPAAMIRKSALAAIGGYDETFLYAQDRDLFLRLMQKGELGIVPEFLFSMRVSPQSISLSKEKNQKMFGIMALEKAVRGGLYPRYYAVWLCLRKALLHLPGPLLDLKTALTRQFGLRHD